MGQISEMQAFVRVVEAGSISKAAEQLGLAKSGVSRRLAELESRLGVRLLNRTTRRQSLTDAGREYYEAAVKLIALRVSASASSTGVCRVRTTCSARTRGTKHASSSTRGATGRSEATTCSMPRRWS